ncbi:MAG: hypothetical protein AAFQ94_31430 [Bacteroidota bacterium]
MTGDALAFTDSVGNRITKEELSKSNGSFNYTIIGAGNISQEAIVAHEEGRRYASAGDYDRAFAKFSEAIQHSPEWPYPVYDLAYSYLLQDDYVNALKYYKLTDSLAPKGFFTSKVALYTLTGEKMGKFKPGLYKMYVSLESLLSDTEREEMTKVLVSTFPDFAPGWKEYANFLAGEQRLAAIETGLKLDCDVQTSGTLLINKALFLANEEKKSEAKEILTDVIFNPESTLGNIELAKFALNNLLEAKTDDK